jgi:hypothetical protein
MTDGQPEAWGGRRRRGSGLSRCQCLTVRWDPGPLWQRHRHSALHGHDRHLAIFNLK